MTGQMREPLSLNRHQFTKAIRRTPEKLSSPWMGAPIDEDVLRAGAETAGIEPEFSAYWFYGKLELSFDPERPHAMHFFQIEAAGGCPQSSLFGSTDAIGRQLWNVGRGLLGLDIRYPDYLALSASSGVRRGGLVGHPHVP